MPPEMIPTAAPATQIPLPAGRYNRRDGPDRRTPSLQSLIYGGFRPRRRAARRVGDDHGFFADWHQPRLLYLSLAILLLCTADAVLTLNLLHVGAVEMNPVMASLIRSNVQLFANIKMALTGIGLISLVTLSNFRVFRRWRVHLLLDVFFAAYTVLILYEISLLYS